MQTTCTEPCSTIASRIRCYESAGDLYGAAQTRFNVALALIAKAASAYTGSLQHDSQPMLTCVRSLDDLLDLLLRHAQRQRRDRPRRRYAQVLQQRCA
jgi:hypothetical protein